MASVKPKSEPKTWDEPDRDDAVTKNGRRVKSETPFGPDSKDLGEVVRHVDAVPHEPEPEHDGANRRAPEFRLEPVSV